LGGDNVLLVDRLDRVGGPPRVAGTARIPATLPPSGRALRPALRAALDSALQRSAATRDFLR